MRYVVPIPFGIYLFFCFIAFIIGFYFLIFVAAIGFIYLLFTAPKQTIGFVAILYGIYYWKIGLPILGVLIVISLVWNKKNEKKKKQESEAAPTDESPVGQLLLEDKSKNE